MCTLFLELKVLYSGQYPGSCDSGFVLTVVFKIHCCFQPCWHNGWWNSTPSDDLEGLHVSYKVHSTFLYHFATPYSKFRDQIWHDTDASSFFDDWPMRTCTNMLGSLGTFVKPWSITKWRRNP